jgi:predicted nucleic acid-binding protein
MLRDWTLIDSNLLVCAHNRQAPLFPPAASLLDSALRRADRWCVSPQNLAEFFAVVTDPRRFPHPLTPGEGARRLDRLWRSRTLHKIYPQRGTLARAAHLAGRLARRGGDFFDVLLAQTMLDNGVSRVVTADAGDFKGIPGITAESPAPAAD